MIVLIEILTENDNGCDQEASYICADKWLRYQGQLVDRGEEVGGGRGK